jgi:hypothetical protein
MVKTQSNLNLHAKFKFNLENIACAIISRGISQGNVPSSRDHILPNFVVD